MAPAAEDNPAVSEGEEPEGTDLAEPALQALHRPVVEPHPSTEGWDDEDETQPDAVLAEPPAPQDVAGDVDVNAEGWAVVPEPEGSEGWEPWASSSSGEDRAPVWGELEDERRLLPPGRTLVGRRAVVRLVGLDTPPLEARLDTGRARSVIHAELLEGAGETLRIRLGGAVVVLPRASSAAHSVAVTLGLEGMELPAVLRVAESTDTEALVLGCDVLAGHFVVDPGRA